jgi:hypothetical protein
MSDSAWMERAAQAAKQTYQALLEEVVERHVLNDREEVPLGQETKRRLERGQSAHPNAIRLLTISGKGGHPGERVGDEDHYTRFYNITLLDHLLSTTRGAIVFAAFEWLNQNPDMNTTVQLRRLRVIAAIAFLHDLDKDLRLPRNTPLTDDMVREATVRYGLDSFLAGVDVHLEPDQIRYLIEKAEASQAHRHPPKVLPPREFESLPLFVRLADQLDGLWCLDDPVRGGLEGVLERIRNDETVLRSGFFKSWKTVRLFDPHHPFLLDDLQRHLSLASLRIAGVPPLIETHRDGELFILLPERQSDEIIKKAIERLCSHLPFGLELNVSNRGVPSLYNGHPSHDALVDFIMHGEGQKKIPELLKIKVPLVASVKGHLDNLLRPVGLEPRWPKIQDSGLVSLYSTLEGMDEASKGALYQAAHLALLLNLKVDTRRKAMVPESAERMNALIELIQHPLPIWISTISGPDTEASKRTLIALWVATLAIEEPKLWDTVWGEDGLLKCWLEGQGGKPGIRDFIAGRSNHVKLGLERRLTQLLGGIRIAPKDELELGRCLFTDEPANFNEPIDQAVGLYGVKVSAFSGREGRPEVLTSERAHTIVSGPSIAEHKLRAKVHENLGGPDEGVPAIISSPTTSGLFGGLALTDDRAMAAMSIYDLNRLDIKKGRIIRETDIHRHRFRMARLERMPEKLADQVNKLRMLLKACRRIGRPIHVFRGLPMSERSYFFYDGMPRVLVDLFGTNSLRLEQIPIALKSLEMAQVLLETPGLGYDVFKRYANPSTRFGAISLAWCELKKENKTPREILAKLVGEYRTHKEENNMSEEDGALVRFGQAAASIQQRPSPEASANEELFVFKVAMDAVTAALRLAQMDKSSLVCAVAGELETNLSRRGKTWLTQPEALRKRCLDVAELFVQDIWLGALKGKMPSQSNRRVMASIYRMAFVTAHRK